MSNINNAKPATPNQSIRKSPIFEKPDTYLPNAPYLAEIVAAELRLKKSDYKNLLSPKSKTISPQEEQSQLVVTFLTEDGQRFTKVCAVKMSIKWPFEAWLNNLLQDAAMADNYPECLIALKVRFIIKNENGFSNFDFFESVEDTNE